MSWQKWGVRIIIGVWAFALVYIGSAEWFKPTSEGRDSVVVVEPLPTDAAALDTIPLNAYASAQRVQDLYFELRRERDSLARENARLRLELARAQARSALSADD